MSDFPVPPFPWRIRWISFWRLVAGGLKEGVVVGVIEGEDEAVCGLVFGFMRLI